MHSSKLTLDRTIIRNHECLFSLSRSFFMRVRVSFFTFDLLSQLLRRRLQDPLVVDVPGVLGQQQEAEAGVSEAFSSEDPETCMLLELLEVVGHVARVWVALSVSSVSAVLAAHVELPAD